MSNEIIIADMNDSITIESFLSVEENRPNEREVEGQGVNQSVKFKEFNPDMND